MIAVVLDQADQLAQLLQIQAGQLFVVGESLFDGHDESPLSAMYTARCSSYVRHCQYKQISPSEVG